MEVEGGQKSTNTVHGKDDKQPGPHQSECHSEELKKTTKVSTNYTTSPVHETD